MPFASVVYRRAAVKIIDDRGIEILKVVEVDWMETRIMIPQEEVAFVDADLTIGLDSSVQKSLHEESVRRTLHDHQNLPPRSSFC